VKIGVPKEIMFAETRVALIPETVKQLTKSGLEVLVESGAGEGAFFMDSVYQDAGAKIVPDATALFAEADLVVKVQKPIFNEKLGKHEVELLHEGSYLVAFLQPMTNSDLVKRLLNQKVTSFSMDAVPRITRAQKLDALSSMSTVAGYKAVLLAANASPKFFPMLMTAAGTIAPARVFVIGAGVAGLQAIATARRLGAVVEAFDTRPVVKEQVESLGAKFVEVDMKVDKTQAEDKGGYAKELSEEFYKKEMEVLHKKASESDVIITTALIPGKPAPCLITEEMVKAMKPGSVIVDLASEMGGNCALTEPGKEVTKHGVTIFGFQNIPALVPFHASQMYSRNMYSFLTHLIRDQKIALDWSDEITAEMCITHAGEIKNKAVKKLVLGESVEAI